MALRKMTNMHKFSKCVLRTSRIYKKMKNRWKKPSLHIGLFLDPLLIYLLVSASHLFWPQSNQSAKNGIQKAGAWRAPKFPRTHTWHTEWRALELPIIMASSEKVHLEILQTDRYHSNLQPFQPLPITRIRAIEVISTSYGWWFQPIWKTLVKLDIFPK